MAFVILYDSFQEGMWFKQLHSQLADATLAPFPREPTGQLGAVLSLDRPDIVLLQDRNPVLVVERTVEVPSGHNVGQRFARLVAAAMARVPCVYFGPYAAVKHGGETSGPRYMNLRLFRALRELELREGSPVTTIRWPTRPDYELLLTPDKDRRMREYMELFFGELRIARSIPALATALLNSRFEAEQEQERDEFVRREVRRAAAYNSPPNSLTIGPARQLIRADIDPFPWRDSTIAVYKVGMRKIRSDPYTGTALLYSYLYCGGLHDRHTPLILHFPYVTHSDWQGAASRGGGGKTIRLYRLAADAIIFKDVIAPRENL